MPSSRTLATNKGLPSMYFDVTVSEGPPIGVFGLLRFLLSLVCFSRWRCPGASVAGRVLCLQVVAKNRLRVRAGRVRIVKLHSY